MELIKNVLTVFKFNNNKINNNSLPFIDIEKSDLPKRKTHETTLQYCIRLINSGINIFPENFSCNVNISSYNEAIIKQNKGCLKKINNNYYLYHAYNNFYYIIWESIYGYGWKQITIKDPRYDFGMWDYESQSFHKIDIKEEPLTYIINMGLIDDYQENEYLDNFDQA